MIPAIHQQRSRPTAPGHPLLPGKTGWNPLIGGWEPGIHAEGEAQALEARLRRIGVDVVRPADAGEGRSCLLDPKREWGLVYVVAHGAFFPWPRSSDSQLSLVDKTVVRAGDWLHSGCRAALVFLNACELGQGVVHRAGDLNGFPLALRARKTTADLSALSPVAPEDAHSFAAAFYEELPDSDSLAAFRQACLTAIGLEKPPSAWAPYVHSGFPVRIPDGHRLRADQSRKSADVVKTATQDESEGPRT
ncbi:CHAT domain-containing protein [Nonomuraea sp. NPDC049400]|uniref:CHAT domain-containing protein n=1 Tax=Nonomuraea sp. NPDC049400 TaxID=3364352 RepID=UPI0037986263